MKTTGQCLSSFKGIAEVGSSTYGALEYFTGENISIGKDKGSLALAKMSTYQTCVLAEYIWLDARQIPRSKTMTMTDRPTKAEDLRVWNYDGSSTEQAEGHNSEVLLYPRAIFDDPFRGPPHVLVLAEAYNAWDGQPSIGNSRAECNEIMNMYAALDPWFGIEQEYTLFRPTKVGEAPSVPLGFNEDGSEPAPQGPYYCSAGTGAAIGRAVADDHYKKCLQAGVKIAGINAEVMPGQWEFQVGPCRGIEMGDHLTVARYIMLRVTEDHNCICSFSPKPKNGDWNGAGCHTNFSVAPMMQDGGYDVILQVCEAFGKVAPEHIVEYGEGNELRLTGKHETCDINTFKYGVANRGASIRIPRDAEKDGKGYMEDRRPAANCDPYRVTRRMLKTAGECLLGAAEMPVTLATSSLPVSATGYKTSKSFSIGKDKGASALAYMGSYQSCVLAEYVWLDAHQIPRSKTMTMTSRPTKPEDLRVWNYDGSSTEQAEGHNSEVLLYPRAIFDDPFRGAPHVLVLAEAYNAWDGKPSIGNSRADCAAIMETYKGLDPWFGIEQEYTLMRPGSVGIASTMPLGFNEDGSEPAPQGPYYTSAGTGVAIGRAVADEHYQKCLDAGVKIAGINAEVMPGQWEFQIGPCRGIEMGDHLTMARYIMLRVTESHDCECSFSPKPKRGDWNGAGCHTNFSVTPMMQDGGYDVIIQVCEAFGKVAKDHIQEYGEGNDQRLTGMHETCDINTFKYGVANRGASIRIPRDAEKDGKGYMEDRRPAANCDPYRVTGRIMKTTGQCLAGSMGPPGALPAPSSSLAEYSSRSYKIGKDQGASALAYMGSFRSCVLAEYVWLDARQTPRSKTMTMTSRPTKPEDLRVWNYDGSSTEQAEGHNSEVLLYPRAIFQDPFRGPPHILVMAEAYNAWDGKPSIGNTRAECAAVMEKYKGLDPWFGIEQEYTLMRPGRIGTAATMPLGFNEDGSEPAPQGPYYTGAGTGVAIGRAVAEDHKMKCLQAGVKISGINAEVMPGQWEFQVGPCRGIEMGDHLTIARYIMLRVTESHNCVCSFSPKPKDGDWNGAGCHTNFSVTPMLQQGGYDVIIKVCEAFGRIPQEHVLEYGEGNDKRLTGKHETCDINTFKYGVANRGASIRIPRDAEKDGKGYMEDRRPAANCDPYRVTSRMMKTTGEVLGSSPSLAAGSGGRSDMNVDVQSLRDDMNAMIKETRVEMGSVRQALAASCADNNKMFQKILSMMSGMSPSSQANGGEPPASPAPSSFSVGSAQSLQARQMQSMNAKAGVPLPSRSAYPQQR
eukprot:TRINITY_DN2787_c0_g1_i1.p1 TRINITY_DN2787_c0_g1~~TRINITY_DN2787_c0_g1_i1.p1  ORF type:complete len:1338 (+),score=223.71 TRINITY_DN2787_c0_g1_i1:145-4014(+)